MSPSTLPRAVKRRASLLPVLIAPAVFSALSACTTSTAIVDHPDLSDTGAHYVRGSWRQAEFRYEAGSALPGVVQQPEPRSFPTPPGLEEQAVLAADYVAGASQLRPTLRVAVTAVPAGVRRVDVQRFRAGAGMPLTLPLAVRHVPGDERYARAAVRRVAHEAAHLIASFHRRSERDEEWAASVIESCAEHSVFGATRGYVFRDELAQPPAGFDPAQRRSVLEALRAARDVERAQLEGGAGSLAALCEDAFTRIREREQEGS